MAYRRKQGGLSRSSTFKEEIRHRDHDVIATATATTSSTAPSSPLARRTNANSPSHSQQAARLDTFLSSGALHSSLKDKSKGSATYDYTSMKSTNEPGGFWCVLARKAKSILDDRQQPPSPTSSLKPTAFSPTNHHGNINYESYSKKNDDHILDSPTSRNDHIHSPTLKNDQYIHSPTLRNDQYIHSPTSRNDYIHSPASRNDHNSPASRNANNSPASLTPYSLNQIGDTIGNALEEAAKKSEDRIQETSGDDWKRILDDDEETLQLKATRHVAIKTADRAKQLLRELKSVKADLAVAIERCCQLEEENKILRETGADQPTPTDDDLIRDQLETLLAEKGVLAHENSVYALENRYLREIVEFHHLSMQDHMHMYLELDQDDDDLLSSINQSHPVSD